MCLCIRVSKRKPFSRRHDCCYFFFFWVWMCVAFTLIKRVLIGAERERLTHAFGSKTDLIQIIKTHSSVSMWLKEREWERRKMLGVIWPTRADRRVSKGWLHEIGGMGHQEIMRLNGCVWMCEQVIQAKCNWFRASGCVGMRSSALLGMTNPPSLTKTNEMKWDTHTVYGTGNGSDAGAIPCVSVCVLALLQGKQSHTYILMLRRHTDSHIHHWWWYNWKAADWGQAKPSLDLAWLFIRSKLFPTDLTCYSTLPSHSP